MTPQELLDYSGGNITQAAVTARVTETCMRNWIKTEKIPESQQRSIEVLTKGALKASPA